MRVDSVDKDVLEDMLERKGYTHLNVRKYGDHLVIYSEENGERVNRARLTRETVQYYQLGMANHQGKWESTPFRGTMDEMVDVLTRDFGFVLAPW